MTPLRASGGRSIAALALCASTAASALGAGDVVISQVWGKGVSVPANLPQASYVELFNRTASPIDMTGWSLQIAPPTGSSWTQLNLSATIQPYSYYLVQTSAGSLTVSVDASFSPTNNILGAAGGPVGNRVALRSSTDPITVACPSGDATIVDLIGFGASAACFETSRGPAISTSGAGGAPTRNQSGCVDTDTNGSDFAAVAPNPHNSASAQNVCIVSGACCDPLTGACSVDTAANCAAAGRSYIGNGTLCSASPCPALGRCCTALPGICYTVTQAGCATVNSGVFTPGVSCSTAPLVCGFTDYPIATTACCFPDGTCCQIDERVRTCASMGGVAPGGAACNPTTGFVCGLTPPANDQCAGAAVLTPGTPRYGSTYAALSNDFCTNLCNSASASVHGVWFSFTPSVSGQYDVSSCGSLFDSWLQVLQVMGSCANPATWSYVACSDDGCTSGFPETGACGSSGLTVNARITGVRMLAGQTYHILLSSGGTGGQGGSGNYKVTIIASATTTFGACCNTVTGQCEMRTAAGCAGSAPPATYQGDGTACTAGLCDIGVGACCNVGGGCVLRTAGYCASPMGGTFLGGSCLPSPCITGACCSQSGSCLTGRTYALCYNNNGTYLGDNSTCTAVTCPQPGACCYANGLCSFLSETACVSPTAQFSVPGTFAGVGVTCTAAACPQPGVCCRGTTCNATVSQAQCTASGSAGASYSTSGSTCNAGSSVTPCCYGDFNKSGGLEVQDIFDFLNAWFSSSLFAKFAGDGQSGTIAVQDIFDFLNAWFTGC